MKIPFDIKYRPQIESGEYKVVTDCGEPVEIVKWDCKGKHPILAVIDDGDTHDSCFYSEHGISYSGTEKIRIILNDPPLTEFENFLKEYYLYMIRDGSKLENNEFLDMVKHDAEELLNIASKQIEKEKVAQLKDTEAYNMGLVDGKAEALKDMPKIDLDKFISSVLLHCQENHGPVSRWIEDSLKDQGLECFHGEIQRHS